MQKVVIFRSNPVAPDPRVEKIALALSKSYEVHVVGWDRTGALETRQNYPTFSLELFSYASPFGSGARNLFRLLRWQIFLFYWVLQHGHSYKVIHACDFDTIFPALLGKLVFGCKVVYDIFDFYADHVRSTPNWLRWIIRRLDFQAIRTIDALILANEAQADQLGGIKPARLVIVYNTPVDSPCEKLSQHEPSINLRIAYVGMLQVERGLLEIIELISKHPTWHFDLAGYGGDEAEILAMASQVPNITWYGRVSHERSLEIHYKADILVATYNPDIPNYRYSSPNKLFEAMMLGKPIIVTRGTYMDQMVEKHACGLVIHYGNLGEIEAAFQSLEENPDLRLRLGVNGRKAYEKFFDWKIMEERLLDLYKEI